MAMRDYLVGEVAGDFADGLLTRREAMRRLGLLGVGLAAATTLLAACGESAPPPGPAPAAPAGPPPGRGPDTPRGADVRFPGPSGELRGAWAGPAQPRAGQA